MYFLKRKLVLYFGNWNSRKKIRIFQETEPSYIWGNWNPKKLIFQEVAFRARKTKKQQQRRKKKPLLKCFLYSEKWNFPAPENLMKLFYNLKKTPVGETGCLSNLYYLLDAEASSFLIHVLRFTRHHTTPEVNTLITFLWLTGHHAMPEVTTFIITCFGQNFIHFDGILI